ncbi:MAG: ABC transporter substrate-binding protein [Dehalococcoidia bacterium]|nr:ABC transporter substrate-binding protein [Dehalococcoidia bacterium]
MSNRSALLYLVFAFSLLIVSAACRGGGDKETPTVNPLTSLPTVSASAVAPTPSASSAPQVIQGSVLAKAMDPFPFEYNNIKYGGTFRYAWTRSYGYLDFKYVPQIWDVYPSVQKPVEWVANPDDSLSHLEPVLAESWKASTDFKTYTITLRKGVKWQNVAPLNGREFTAEDVVYNVQRYSEKDSVRIAFYSQVESVAASDRYTVTIKLKEPNGWLMNDLWGGLDWLLPQELVKEAGGTIGTKLIGTGPYILKEYIPNQRASYVRNPDYWGKDAKGNPLPYTDGIDFVFVADNATATAAFRTGQLDTGPSFSSLGSAAAVDAVAKSLPGMRIVNLGAAQPRHLSFNTRKAPWNDVRVRRAFNMYIDKEKFAENIFEAGTWVQSTPLTWSDVSYKPFTLADLGPYAKYAPGEAKQLLIDAGFPEGKMKIKSSLEFAAGTGTTSHGVFAQNLQQSYKQFGIEFDLVSLPQAAYYSKWYLRTYEDLSLGFINTGDYSLLWYSQNKFLDNALQNISIVSDPEVQKVVKAIKVEWDPIKLREYAKFLWDFDTLGSWNIWVPVQGEFNLYSPRTRSFAIRKGASYTGLRMLPWLADANRTGP